MNNPDPIPSIAFLPEHNQLNHLRCIITDLALRSGGDIVTILHELENTSWNEWIAEAIERKNGAKRLVRCDTCYHNMEYPPPGPLRLVTCEACLQEARNKGEHHRNTPRPCSVCGGTHALKDLLEVTIPTDTPSYTRRKAVCPILPDKALDPLKLTCVACDTRYLPFHSKTLCNTCWEGPIRLEFERVHANNQRAKKLNLPATLTIKQWLGTLDHFKKKCAYCQKKPYSLLEHYAPIPIGGTTANNCLPACHSCNIRKKGLHPSSFDALFPSTHLAEIGRYFQAVSSDARTLV